MLVLDELLVSDQLSDFGLGLVLGLLQDTLEVATLGLEYLYFLIQLFFITEVKVEL